MDTDGNQADERANISARNGAVACGERVESVGAFGSKLITDRAT
jgi:hypothetical protein